MPWQNYEKGMVQKNVWDFFFNRDVLHSVMMYDFYPTGIINGYPRSCYGVHNNGYHIIDPEQDGVDPITVFCNTSTSPVTAMLHHNLENWTLVTGYESPGSYNAEVSCGQLVPLVTKSLGNCSLCEPSYTRKNRTFVNIILFVHILPTFLVSQYRCTGGLS